MPVSVSDSLKLSFHIHPAFVPTRTISSAIAHLPDTLSWTKHGILRIDPSGSQGLVAGMPLLCQSDPALDAPLDAFLATQEMPQKQGADGKPLFHEAGQQAGQPIRYTRAEMRELLKGYGCYNTAIHTVIVTALANRASDLDDVHALIGRTAEVAAIGPGKFEGRPEVPKHVMQLAWHYEQQFKNGIGAEVAGKRVQPLYFHEVVADLGKGAIKEQCDPYSYGSCASATLANGDASAFRTFSPSAKELNNEHIIDLMKQGVVPMIAYNRHEPVLCYNPIQNTLNVTFHNVPSYHKVVFSGFQAGDYPLLVNDVGSGQRVRVRISAKLGEIKFALPQVTAAPTFDPAFQDRPFLIYEGDDKQTNPRIFFVDHYDGLRIRSGLRLEQQVHRPVDAVALHLGR